MSLEVEQVAASQLRSAADVRDLLDHGRRILATVLGKDGYAIVRMQDLRALSALTDLRPCQIARIFRSAKTQGERKALVVILEWMANEGIVDSDNTTDQG